MAYEILGNDDDVLAGMMDIMGDEMDLSGEDEDISAGMALAMGDEMADLMSAAAGARRRRRARGRGRGGIPQSVARLAAAERLARSGALVQQRSPNRPREYVLGFDSVAAIAAGALFVAQNTPQIVFRPERLIIPSDIGGLFNIVNIVIGKNPALAALGSVPARTFSELGVGVRLQCDTVQPGMSIFIQIQNISLAPARFTAAFIGSAVE